MIIDNLTALTILSIRRTLESLAPVSPLTYNLQFHLLTVISMRLFHTSSTRYHTQMHHYPIKRVHFLTSVFLLIASQFSNSIHLSNLSMSLPSPFLHISAVANSYRLSLKYFLYLFLPFNSHCSHLG